MMGISGALIVEGSGLGEAPSCRVERLSLVKLEFAAAFSTIRSQSNGYGDEVNTQIQPL